MRKKKDEAINIYFVVTQNGYKVKTHCIDLMCMDLQVGEYVIFENKNYRPEEEKEYSLGKIVAIIQTTDSNIYDAVGCKVRNLSPIVGVWNVFEAIDSFERRKKEIGLEDLLEDDEEYEVDELGF